jgi:hypothetical protein
MHKFKSFIAVLFLALLLVPAIDKTIHELGHLKETQCGEAETHFCKAEHHCTICAYVFASSSTPPQKTEHFYNFLERSSKALIPFSFSEKKADLKFTFQLRGPPVLA